jgi:protease-4
MGEARMAVKKIRVLGVIALALIVTFGTVALIAASLMQESGLGGLDWGAARIGVIKITGVISESGRIRRTLERYARRESIRAIILRVNSPGGAVAPSQEIYEAVKKAAAKKPVVASFDSVAASGGYYVSAPATRIVANPSSLTGSIGVVLVMTNYHQALKNLGVKVTLLHQGRFKTMGSPFAPKLAPEERAKLEGLLAVVYRRFQHDVYLARKAVLTKLKGKAWVAAHWTPAAVKALATGEVFTGEQALQNGLVDSLGGLRRAVAVAKQLAKIKGQAKLVYPDPRDRSLWDALLGRVFGRVNTSLPPSGAAVWAVWMPGYGS